MVNAYSAKQDSSNDVVVPVASVGVAALGILLLPVLLVIPGCGPPIR
jgi:hypothetical protein